MRKTIERKNGRLIHAKLREKFSSLRGRHEKKANAILAGAVAHA